MPPGQPYPPPPRPQQPQQPPDPQAPHYGYGTALPGHSPNANHFHQHPNGHYEVVPAPPSAGNDGHTGHNQYDFIVNPNTNGPKVSFAAGLTGGSSFFIKIGLLAGGVVVLLVVAGVLISAFTPKGSTPGLISIAQRQQEIARVASDAEQQTTSQDAKNFVTNVDTTVTSSQQQVVSYLTAHGTKLGSKTLALDQNAQTDTQLANALTANNYDNAVTQYMVTQLQVYENLLQTTYGQTGNVSTKALLQNDFNNASLLLKQAKALQQELNS